MMIASSSRMWMIAKLTLLVLVFLGFWISYNTVYWDHCTSTQYQLWDAKVHTCVDKSQAPKWWSEDLANLVACWRWMMKNSSNECVIDPNYIETAIDGCPSWFTMSEFGKCVDPRWYEACVAWDSACEQFQKWLAGWLSAAEYWKLDSEGKKIVKCEVTYSKDYCNCKYKLKWIYLNTEVPFVWADGNKRCLVMETASSGPVSVLRALTQILMTFVMIGGFGMIVWWGVQIAWWDVKWGKEKIIWVAIAFALLWSLWVILRFINPNFFS
jgi:hypothetical protein